MQLEEAVRTRRTIKAYDPDVAVAPTGEFVVVWHEEQWPGITTVVQPVWLDAQ